MALALQQFRFAPAWPLSQRRFLMVVGDCLAHLHRVGLGAKRACTTKQARAEAIALLQETYQSAGGVGYLAAVLDARLEDSGGLDPVLVCLAEGLKARQRDRYTRSVYRRLLDGAEWPVRCVMAGLLREKGA